MEYFPYPHENQTGLGTNGVLDIKDPPSKIRMGPQRPVAGDGVCKFGGGGTGEAMHAILSSSLAHVFQLLETSMSSCPLRPYPQL